MHKRHYAKYEGACGMFKYFQCRPGQQISSTIKTQNVSKRFQENSKMWFINILTLTLRFILILFRKLITDVVTTYAHCRAFRSKWLDLRHHFIGKCILRLIKPLICCINNWNCKTPCEMLTHKTGISKYDENNLKLTDALQEIGKIWFY